MEEKKLSIKRIAELTGYSVATVSRVINQNGRFSKETEKKIRQVIDELGYVPDAAAKSLRTNVSKTVAIIMPTLANELFAKIFTSIQKNLQDRGYLSVLYPTYEGEDWMAQKGKARDLLPLLRSINVCGVVVISVRGAYESMDPLGVPVVFVDCNEEVPGPRKTVIQYDGIQSGQIAAKHLLEKGCKHIAAMTSCLTGKDCDYYFAVKRTLEAAGQALHFYPELHQAEPTFQSAVTATAAAWDQGIRFDGLILPKDDEAVAASLALLQRGVRIPEEVKLLGYDDVSSAVNTMIPLTTLRVETEQVGQLSAACLIDMLEGTNAYQRSYKLPLTLVERAST